MPHYDETTPKPLPESSERWRPKRHGQAKLTWSDVETIRRAKGPSGLGLRLAKAYGVSSSHISEIRSGKKWRPHPWE